ncbi:HNH endonuclease [Streptomyces sp. NPDC007172]|uniref:HNH endonuclease n=1 Tax=Streptomyces sp. NPDC007172 TaxID=3364776 RepID=UPI00368D13CB
MVRLVPSGLPADRVDVHHVRLLSVGGEDIDSNVQVLCHGCHGLKTRTEFGAARVAWSTTERPPQDSTGLLIPLVAFLPALGTLTLPRFEECATVAAVLGPRATPERHPARDDYHGQYRPHGGAFRQSEHDG